MTTPYRNILCPIDFSDISRLALAWSLEFAKQIEGDLTVLHVIDTALLHVGNLVAVPQDTAELRQAAEARFAEWSSDLELSKAKLLVDEGPPADTIVKATEDRNVDLLVMGTHGVSGLQKLLLGSVMEKVLHRVRVPLLSFSPKSPGDAHAPKTILMAVDFGPETASVVRHGIWLAEHYRAKLLTAHVVPIPYVVLNDRTMERLTPEQLERLKDTLTADRREELNELLPETISTGATVEVVATVGSSYPALADLVAGRSVDLVVMGAGGHGGSGLGWLGSTCHKMVRAAPCPVLIVR